MHVLGMAKSSLCLKGAKASKLELDFFKLAFTVTKLRASNEEAIGYLQVLSPIGEDRAQRWVTKYQAAGIVEILFSSLDDRELAALVEEKTRNAFGLLTAPATKGAGLSLASIGRQLGESVLERGVLARHPAAIRVDDKRRFPFGILWDYYGIVE